EKPSKDKIFSLLSILGRVLLTPDIFDILEYTKPGAGNEIQLTDAMRELAVTKGMTACEFEGTRYDMGSKFGFLQANIDMGLLHPEVSAQLKEYIKALAATFN
ncbi:MAG: UTP--glucose-1-phosphate uridylyltransferase, partial [Clostridia bacterium]